MSHELRMPLNAILGFSDLLLDQLIVLDLSKVEAGKLALRPERVALDALIEPVVVSMRSATQAHGVDFSVASTETLPLFVDPIRVRQILYNLLSNAVKFTPRGGRVDLRVRVEGTELQFDVSDTGMGILKESHSRVFGTFERLHEGRTSAQSTGLGLALTKRIVELHGGIVFESAVDRGTTFRVRCPA